MTDDSDLLAVGPATPFWHAYLLYTYDAYLHVRESVRSAEFRPSQLRRAFEFWSAVAPSDDLVPMQIGVDGDDTVMFVGRAGTDRVDIYFEPEGTIEAFDMICGVQMLAEHPDPAAVRAALEAFTERVAGMNPEWRDVFADLRSRVAVFAAEESARRVAWLAAAPAWEAFGHRGPSPAAPLSLPERDRGLVYCRRCESAVWARGQLATAAHLPCEAAESQLRVLPATSEV